jgi:hypothetical protein
LWGVGEGAGLLKKISRVIKGKRMNITEKYEKLMEFICDRYSNSDTFQAHGEQASVIILEFQRFAGIRFGLSDAQKAAMIYLLEQGWIELVSRAGTRIQGT